MCVFYWNFVEELCAEIDGFDVCVLLELSDGVQYMLCSEILIRYRN